MSLRMKGVGWLVNLKDEQSITQVRSVFRSSKLKCAYAHMSSDLRYIITWGAWTDLAFKLKALHQGLPQRWWISSPHKKMLGLSGEAPSHLKAFQCLHLITLCGSSSAHHKRSTRGDQCTQLNQTIVCWSKVLTLNRIYNVLMINPNFSYLSTT